MVGMIMGVMMGMMVVSSGGDGMVVGMVVCDDGDFVHVVVVVRIMI